MNLARLLSETAARHPGKPAVVFEGTPCTYGAFDREVERYAAMLHATGVAKGDRVAVQLPKRMEFLFLHLANLSVGAVTLPLNAEYRPEEVEYFLSDSGSSLFVTDGERFARAAETLRGLRGVRTLLLDGGGGDGAERLSDRLSGAPAGFRRSWPAGGDDPAMICYTSGTTGRSKGAVITHRNLVSNLLALHDAWEWTGNDVLLHVLPLFHVHGLNVATHGSLYAGSTIVMHGKFDPGRAWDALEAHGCTLFMGVPTVYQRLMGEWEKRERKARPARDAAVHLRVRAAFRQPLPPVRAGHGVPDPGAVRHDRDGDDRLEPDRPDAPEGEERGVSPGGSGNTGGGGRRRRRLPGGGGGGLDPGGQRVPRILGDAREDGGVVRGRLVPVGGPRVPGPGRRREAVPGRPGEGTDHHRRLQCLPEGDRERAGSPRGGEGVRGGRASGRGVRGEGRRRGRAEGGVRPPSRRKPSWRTARRISRRTSARSRSSSPRIFPGTPWGRSGRTGSSRAFGTARRSEPPPRSRPYRNSGTIQPPTGTNPPVFGAYRRM